MTRIGRYLLALSAAALLAGCGLFGDDDEELEPAELIEFETRVPVKRLWSTTVGGDAEFLRVALRPMGDGNRIYAASVNGNVVALNPENGKQAWRNKLGIGLSSGPGVGEGLVVVVAAVRRRRYRTLAILRRRRIAGHAAGARRMGGRTDSR